MIILIYIFVRWLLRLNISTYKINFSICFFFRNRMENFFSKVGVSSTSRNVGSSSTPNVDSTLSNIGPFAPNIVSNLEFESDHGLRKNIYDYDVNIREDVRRTYLQKGRIHLAPPQFIFWFRSW